MKYIVLLIWAGLLFAGCATTSKTNKSNVKESTGTIMVENMSALVAVGASDINGGKSWDPKIGGLVGIETKLHKFSDRSSINSGINFSFQGAKYTESYEIDPYLNLLKSGAAENEFSGVVNLTYINIPFFYYYQCDAGFYGEIGIQPSFLIGAKDKPDGASAYDFKDYINTFDIGIPVGAGYKITDQFGIGVRANFGLTNINSEGTEMYSSDDTDRNFMLLLVLGYRFKK